MPHPRATEAAANRIRDLLAALDQRLLNAAQQGQRLPSAASTMAQVIPLIETAIRAAFNDITPVDEDDPDLNFYIAATIEQVERYVTRTIRDHQLLADEVSASTVDPEDDRSPTALARAGLLGTAVVAMATRQRRLVRRQQLANLTQAARRLPPRQSAGRSRGAVRTIAAIGRNQYAANIADRRGEGWAIYVEDARLGPTDEPCERVDGQWATSTWLRNHPSQHENCTRRGRPRSLPDGVFPTLIR